MKGSTSRQPKNKQVQENTLSIKICHLTTVHSRTDSRIVRKECISLAKAGFETILIVADNKGDESYKNIRIMGLKRYNNVLLRSLIYPWLFFIKAIKQKCKVYHFHDPELIFTGILLRIAGRKVIYDIHEDYKTAFLHRNYLPGFLRKIIAGVWSFYEKFSARLFICIIAEKYYKERFSNSLLVANYPVFEEIPDNEYSISDNQMIYTGSIDEIRGAYIYAELIKKMPDYKLNITGFCDETTREEVMELSNHASDRLHISNPGVYVPFEQIRQLYFEEDWLCGLAIFPYSKHYERKELTKFFEYMMHGIPVVCSDFKAWRDLIEGNQAGLVVDPRNINKAIESIEWLRKNPEKRKIMGENGKKLVKEYYNWSKEESKLIDLYKNLVD